MRDDILVEIEQTGLVLLSWSNPDAGRGEEDDDMDIDESEEKMWELWIIQRQDFVYNTQESLFLIRSASRAPFIPHSYRFLHSALHILFIKSRTASTCRM